jgi:hypothetical protein
MPRLVNSILLDHETVIIIFGTVSKIEQFGKCGFVCLSREWGVPTVLRTAIPPSDLKVDAPSRPDGVEASPPNSVRFC